MSRLVVKSEESNTSDLPVHKEILSVQCPLCTNKVCVYRKRSDFLKHLSLGHFGVKILQSNPYKDGLA